MHAEEPGIFLQTVGGIEEFKQEDNFECVSMCYKCIYTSCICVQTCMYLCMYIHIFIYVCMCINFIWEPKYNWKREKLKAGRPVYLVAQVIED